MNYFITKIIPNPHKSLLYTHKCLHRQATNKRKKVCAREREGDYTSELLISLSLSFAVSDEMQNENVCASKVHLIIG